MPNPLPPTWTRPTSKWFASVLATLIGTLALVVAEDSTILERLPDELEAIAVTAFVAIAVYLRGERHPSIPVID